MQKKYLLSLSLVVLFLLVLSGCETKEKTDLIFSQKNAPSLAQPATLQEAFVLVAELAKPYVVNISSYQIIDDPHPFRFSGHARKWWNKWLNKLLQLFVERKYKIESLGSGFIIAREGYILTNHHVVQQASEIRVKLFDKRELEAKLVGSDVKTDIAVIKVKTIGKLSVAKLGDSDHLRVGEWVIAVGSPYGLDRTVTVGVVSALGRSDLGITMYENYIQTDASINPGNSGGPLLNLRGEIIGINTAIIPSGIGIGFAIPITMAKSIARQLIQRGEVVRGWIGVSMQTLTPDLATSLHVEHFRGVLVNKVFPSSPAATGGLKVGDIIIGFNGQEVTDAHALQQMVLSSRIGQKVQLSILRDGQAREVKLKIDKMPS